MLQQPCGLPMRRLGALPARQTSCSGLGRSAPTSRSSSRRAVPSAQAGTVGPAWKLRNTWLCILPCVYRDIKRQAHVTGSESHTSVFPSLCSLHS